MAKFSYARLRGKMVELGFSQEALAKAIHLSPTALNNKLMGYVQFKQREMVAILDALGIPLADIVEYFFCFDT